MYTKGAVVAAISSLVTAIIYDDVQTHMVHNARIEMKKHKRIVQKLIGIETQHQSRTICDDIGYLTHNARKAQRRLKAWLQSPNPFTRPKKVYIDEYTVNLYVAIGEFGELINRNDSSGNHNVDICLLSQYQ